ncbi:non-ribosomal peptide synthetase [Streptomyces sp. WZ-12]|uniref:non-ribosomal peptide synthetase n=1 Tax=Streptomyces sp. WZ-12 TaxID=3030210 RepID=UPI0023819052|nr:amino acid adenylation domain-containing protein [Streptomyces sp. WZ-12]
MDNPQDVDREYWTRVLSAGGFTAIPRWAPDPATGVAEHELPLPDALVTRLRQRTDGLDVRLNAALLAAHAKVLAALAGEREVVTGYLSADGGPALPCRVSTGSRTWRELARDAAWAAAELRSHHGYPVDALRAELGLAQQPPFEVELDLSGTDDELADTTVLRLAILRHDGRITLHLRYRTEVLDAKYAARITGYHLTALARFAADPDAEHATQSLLSVAERRFQLEALTGPDLDLPDHRFHELFEERVRRHPDAVAAVHGGRQWTYQELNSHANRLGRALLAQGLTREGVVAVVTERNLDWMAAVLAVFKAGGVYLPIEPHFPPDRIAAVLTRAECRLVLTEPGSTATLDQALAALPDTHSLDIHTVLADDDLGTDDLGVDVGADQLAYIYFTSGSTGEPKGAMCEHAGFLNHLYAKIGDLGIIEGSVVAQTAPQCFDISLWQLVSALLVGGRTHLVEQKVILDVPRFVDTLADGRITVLQVVPSYLEAVLTHLELHPSQLPDLRCVSVTGEELKTELAQRWFGAVSGIRLVNAYGLTETSDDTNHEVMEGAPDDGRIPLGPCVNNVRVYIVDDNLEPVPLGAPGQIVFSGVCVGRGYVNDPERTRDAFLDDPHYPGQRLYKGGDYGRWLPGAKLEFLGRRDAQVKVRGFRIEIGEIENALLRAPGVRDGAVTVAGDHQSKRLVAFYSGPQPLHTESLRKQLAKSLPSYMVPGTFHWREQLPLTANGKIDKKALTALANQPEDVENHQAPRTPAERRLAGAWAKILGVPEDRIGRHDHFFDLGGTSLSAVKLAIALDRAVSLKDLTRHPVLADLAALLDGQQERRRGLLHTLAEPEGEPIGHLVCFPYAGGNAVNFQQVARHLQAGGLAVHAVELPGHDLAVNQEPFAPLERVVEQVVAEITQRGLTEVLLWGHSSGTAFALATAQLLQARQAPAQRVFLSAQLPGEAPDRYAAASALAAQSDEEIAKELSADSGYGTLGDLDRQRATRAASAYRHDALCAHRYFAGALDRPPTARLTTPLTVIVADDDPITADAAHRHLQWRTLADHVDLHQLPDGGHYFPRTRPAETAQAVLRAVHPPTTPR